MGCAYDISMAEITSTLLKEWGGGVEGVSSDIVDAVQLKDCLEDVC